MKLTNPNTRALFKAGSILYWFCAALFMAGMPAAANAQAGASSNISEFALQAGSNPFTITTGPDGALWFTEAGSNLIGRITTGGSISTYSGLSLYPEGITTGPDGALWFTETNSGTGANAIGRITTGGAITEFPLTVYYPGPTSITTGPDGALWFTEPGLNSIGRITTDGDLSSYAVGGPLYAGAQQITTGPDGALWFTTGTNYSQQSEIGRITTAGVVTLYPLSGNVYPYGIVTGPDGALWFTEYYANKIGRITTSGVISEYAIPTASSAAEGITAGGDGALWFVESKANQVGRITTAAVFTEYPIDEARSTPQGITSGPDGALWFTQERGEIGRAPACGLGLRLGYAAGTLDISFALSIDVGATFATTLITATGTERLFSKPIPAIVTPRVFTIPVTNGVPASGTVEVKATLSGAQGSYYCQEYQSLTIP